MSGVPDEVIWGDASVQSRLEPLVEPIKAALGGAAAKLPGGATELNAAVLARVALDVQKFQHRVLGPDAPRSQLPHPLRIPAAFFLPGASLGSLATPVAPASPLAVVLETAVVTAAKDASLPSWNVNLPANETAFRKIVAQIRTALREKRHLRTPRVAAGSDLTQAEADNSRKLAGALECE